jgi:ABC-type nickel/cobalt efflux system permease component RcnA
VSSVRQNGVMLVLIFGVWIVVPVSMQKQSVHPTHDPVHSINHFKASQDYTSLLAGWLEHPHHPISRVTQTALAMPSRDQKIISTILCREAVQDT